MRKFLLPISLATLFWSACKKAELPDGSFNDPIFFTAFETDSTGISMTAGKNNTYHFTRVERDTNEVLAMSGAFADASCPTGDCPGSIRFEFRNTNQENFAQPDLIFAGGQSWEYKSPFDTLPSLHKVSIRWVQPNGTILRSDLLLQPQDSSGGSLSHFNILASEPWEQNEHGEMTWKMDVQFSCWLFDSIQQHPEVRIFGGGVIAVGYR